MKGDKMKKIFLYVLFFGILFLASTEISGAQQYFRRSYRTYLPRKLVVNGYVCYPCPPPMYTPPCAGYYVPVVDRRVPVYNPWIPRRTYPQKIPARPGPGPYTAQYIQHPDSTSKYYYSEQTVRYANQSSASETTQKYHYPEGDSSHGNQNDTSNQIGNVNRLKRTLYEINKKLKLLEIKVSWNASEIQEIKDLRKELLEVRQLIREFNNRIKK
jgi:hypothetical protein